MPYEMFATHLDQCSGHVYCFDCTYNLTENPISSAIYDATIFTMCSLVGLNQIVIRKDTFIKVPEVNKSVKVGEGRCIRLILHFSKAYFSCQAMHP